ncbi:MAG: hypothetical protein JWM76_3632 [Pseudonocardiales bacterium]|nr:hypothetical protein [Pseudonocardiales bacterium]
MNVTIDLRRCQDQGQCIVSAPSVFVAGDDGRLAVRQQSIAVYQSGELDDVLMDDVEDAASICPTQAITVRY